MTYKQIRNLGEREFKRLCGVKPKVFEEMVEVLKEESPKGKPRGGQAKLSVEDQLLISLEYWREYRTYFHISKSWGIHESTIAWSAELRSAAFPLGSREPGGSAVAKQRRIAEGNRRIVHRVEDKLIKSRKFSLPGRKALASTNAQWEVVIVDAGESPIEHQRCSQNL